ncbi:MAG: hypothetical protein V4733_09025 [Verrucomicrobiota bacterium]
MILHASAAFVKRFKCDVTGVDKAWSQSPRMDAWSSHHVRLGTTPLVLAMHDMSLYTLLIPAKGARTFADVWMRMVGRICETWWQHGAEFDPNNQAVIVLPRSDRRRIGSMNEMVHHLRWMHSDGCDLIEMEHRINQTPLRTISYNSPARKLAELLKG